MKSYFTTEKSSQISAMEHDSETEVLQITFKRGGVYEYYGVPWDVWEDLISRESVGKGFHALIRGQYEYKKLS